MKIDSQGRITLPRELRGEFKPGDKVLVIIVGGAKREMILRKVE